MERDFMGLSSKNILVAVKEENPDGCKDSAPARGSAMQWSFSNKVCALPQFLSFKGAQEDRPRKTGYDSLTSTGFMTISSAEAFDSKHKSYSGHVQKSSTLDKQGGTHYSVTTYTPQHFDAHSVHRPHEVKILPVASQTNQTISVAMGTPVHQSFLASAGQNVIGSTVNPQPLGGVPVIAPVSIVPCPNSIVGTTELRDASKSSGSPAQLTIFYAGSVCVYDNISPEKAQAIMLLAGNGPSVTPNTTFTTAQVQAPMPRPSAGDGFVGNQFHNRPPCPFLPSPISVTSNAGPQSAAGSSSTNEITAVKSTGTLASPSNKSEPSKAVSSLGSVPATLIPSAVPQARKASLARFLEKRKERVMSASPYASKQSPDCSTPGSEGRSFSMNSAGSSPLPAIN
uniref:Protein TIFY n=1 Tax=Davidia involucrata TaxID=16924 RepID=A0A5B7BU60_DAVIN